MLLALALECSSYTLSHYARNAYDFEPVENAYVVLTCNDSGAVQDGFSDSTGETEFTVVYGNYSVTVSKPGFNDRVTQLNITDSVTRVSYLTYESESSVRFVFSDMTFMDHQWCFFTENGDLTGCWLENDTVLLSLGHNYTAYPKLSIWEQAGITGKTGGFMAQMLVFLTAGTLMLSFAAALACGAAYGFWRLLK